MAGQRLPDIVDVGRIDAARLGDAFDDGRGARVHVLVLGELDHAYSTNKRAVSPVKGSGVNMPAGRRRTADFDLGFPVFPAFPAFPAAVSRQTAPGRRIAWRHVSGVGAVSAVSAVSAGHFGRRKTLVAKTLVAGRRCLQLSLPAE